MVLRLAITRYIRVYSSLSLLTAGLTVERGAFLVPSASASAGYSLSLIGYSLTALAKSVRSNDWTKMDIVNDADHEIRAEPAPAAHPAPQRRRPLLPTSRFIVYRVRKSREKWHWR